MSQPSITIFTQPNCPYCASSKLLLSKNGYAYIEHNVNASKRAAAASIYFSGSTSVPQVFLGSYALGNWETLEKLINTGYLEVLVTMFDLDSVCSTLNFDGLSDAKLFEGAKDISMASAILESDFTYEPDEDLEERALLHFYKDLIGFLPTSQLYFYHWQRAYKLVNLLQFVPSASFNIATYGPAMMNAVAYTASSTHGQSPRKAHAAAIENESALKIIEALQKARKQPAADNPFGPYELALADLAGRAALNNVSTHFLSYLEALAPQARNQLEGMDSDRPRDAKADIDAVATMSATFGFLNVFNDLLGQTGEGSRAFQTDTRLGMKARRRAASKNNKASASAKLDYPLPIAPPYKLIAAQYASDIGDIDKFIKRELGLFPNWMLAWPQGSAPALQAYLYTELMGNRLNERITPELRHLMARVSAIAKGHSYLAALEGFLAYRFSGSSGFGQGAITRIRSCFKVATSWTDSENVFSYEEIAALRLAWISAQVPLATPKRFVQAALDAFDSVELIHLITTCAIASMVQRFVAIARPEMEPQVIAFIAEHNIEYKTLVLRYPITTSNVAKAA